MIRRLDPSSKEGIDVEEEWKLWNKVQAETHSRAAHNILQKDPEWQEETKGQLEQMMKLLGQT